MHGCGASRWCPPSRGRRQRLQADRQVGRALPRSRGARVHLPRKRARHAQQQNDVQVTRTLEHLSTLRWRCRMAHAEGRPHVGWFWVACQLAPPVQSHGKCALCVYVRYMYTVLGRGRCAFEVPCVAVDTFQCGGLYVWSGERQGTRGCRGLTGDANAVCWSGISVIPHTYNQVALVHALVHASLYAMYGWFVCMSASSYN